MVFILTDGNELLTELGAGRTRRTHALFEAPKSLQKRICIRTNLQSS